MMLEDERGDGVDDDDDDGDDDEVMVCFIVQTVGGVM